ncbi:bifunctional metallophosphatase/5'-nucleotidase, partial [Candidatus Poribacteria bacterium]
MKKHLKVSLLAVIAFVGLLPVSQGIYAEELVILYTNDLHAQVEPMKATWLENKPLMGGFANIAAYVDEVRAAKQNVVFFDAGDMLTGPAISSLTQGEAVFDIVNTMGFDAATFGNHEFDHGWKNTKKLLYQADFPVLSANTFYEGTNILFAKPYEIIEKGDLKIGVIGILGKRCGDGTIMATSRQGIEFREQEAIIQEYVNILKPHVDLIVLLAHEGKLDPQLFTAEADPQRVFQEADPQRILQKDVEIAKNVKGIDVLITGHLHKGVEEPIFVEETGTLIVSAYGNGIVVGCLGLVIKQFTHLVLPYSSI